MASFFLRLDSYLSSGNAWLQVKRGRFSEGADQGTSRRVKIEQVLAISAGVGLVSGAGYFLKRHNEAIRVHVFSGQRQSQGCSPLPFASSSLSRSDAASVAAASNNSPTEPKTGLVFPQHLDGQELLGLGVREKRLFGLVSVKVYAYGVYANRKSVKTALGRFFKNSSLEQLKGDASLCSQVAREDTEITVRLVIFHKGLKIGQVRKAFEESMGRSIERFNSAPNQELLDCFTSQFKDDFKLERGTTIEITRKAGHVLQTKIGSEVAGVVKSDLLSRAFFDLYIGRSPFDANAKASVASGVANILAA